MRKRSATTYFNASSRTNATDKIWPEKQAGRELVSTFTMFKIVENHVKNNAGNQQDFWVDGIPEDTDH